MCLQFTHPLILSVFDYTEDSNISSGTSGNRMATKKNKAIYISPRSKRNRLTLVLSGGILLLISFVANLAMGQENQAIVLVLVFACFIVTLIGVLKFLEPNNSFYITPEFLRFYHRSGRWQLRWQDIVRFGELKLRQMDGDLTLPYLGIKLYNLEHIARNISPRLANRLIHEQKELITIAIKRQEIEFKEGIIHFEPYIIKDTAFEGPIGAWLYHTEALNKAYGFHLFIPENSLDREPEEFLALLKECHEYVRVNG